MNRSNINTGHGVRKAARFTRRSRKRPMSTSKTTVRVQPRHNPNVIIFMNPNSCLFFAIWDDIHVTFHAAYVVITFHYNNRMKQLKRSFLNFCRFLSPLSFCGRSSKSKRMTRQFLDFG
jgi:hypothetical protein